MSKKDYEVSEYEVGLYTQIKDFYLVDTWESCSNKSHEVMLEKLESMFKNLREGCAPKFCLVDANQLSNNTELFKKPSIDFFLMEAQNDLRYTLTTTENGEGENANFPMSVEQKEYLQKYIKPYYFLSYNSFAKTHRLYFLQESLKRNFFDKGLLSFLDPLSILTPTPQKIEFHGEVDLIDWDYVEKNISPKLPIRLDEIVDDEGLNRPISELGVYHKEKNNVYRRDRYVNPQHITDSYFNVVCESNVRSDMLFITEKTYKAVLLQPFIIIGTPYTLSKLREHGFETFPELFDESYDEILDMRERLNFILNEIEKVCKLDKKELHQIYLKVLPKVIYNQRHFLNMDIKDLVFDAWNKIFWRDK